MSSTHGEGAGPHPPPPRARNKPHSPPGDALALRSSASARGPAPGPGFPARGLRRSRVGAPGAAGRSPQGRPEDREGAAGGCRRSHGSAPPRTARPAPLTSARPAPAPSATALRAARSAPRTASRERVTAHAQRTQLGLLGDCPCSAAEGGRRLSERELIGFLR